MAAEVIERGTLHSSGANKKSTPGIDTEEIETVQSGIYGGPWNKLLVLLLRIYLFHVFI